LGDTSPPRPNRVCARVGDHPQMPERSMLIRENLGEDGWIDTDRFQEVLYWSERNDRRRSRPAEVTEHQTALRS